MNIIRWTLFSRLKWITVELYSWGLSEYLGTTSLQPFSDSFGLTALVQRLFVRMLVTMWLLLVHGKQECLGVGPVCDMDLPRFQHTQWRHFCVIRCVEMCDCCTYAPFFCAIFEGGVLTPPPLFVVGGEDRGENLHPILLTSSEGAKEP